MKTWITLLVVLLVPALARGQRSRFEMPEPKHRVEKNVVYGMYSGLALLMDIHHPDKPNGYGVIHISGSGWTAPLGMDALQKCSVWSHGLSRRPFSKAGRPPSSGSS